MSSIWIDEANYIHSTLRKTFDWFFGYFFFRFSVKFRYLHVFVLNSFFFVAVVLVFFAQFRCTVERRIDMWYTNKYSITTSSLTVAVITFFSYTFGIVSSHVRRDTLARIAKSWICIFVYLYVTLACTGHTIFVLFSFISLFVYAQVFGFDFKMICKIMCEWESFVVCGTLFVLSLWIYSSRFE